MAKEEPAKNPGPPKRPVIREVLPKKGLIFQESDSQPVLCKPKLLPLKSFTLEKLERMQKEAAAKARETVLEAGRRQEEGCGAEDAPGGETRQTHAPECVTFD